MLKILALLVIMSLTPSPQIADLPGPEVVPIRQEVKTVHPLTSRERDLIERVVATESRGCSLEAQMAVAQVIRDRSVLWGKSIEDVIFSPSQFGNPYRGEISDRTKLAVSLVYDSGEEVFPELATHFHDDSIQPPYWAKSKVSRGSIDRLKFYK